MTKVTHIDNRGSAVSWSPIGSCTDLIALGSKVRLRICLNTEIITLDEYVKEKNISNIDILKIDTQGFEDKVLLGAQNLLKNNRIKLIQLELIFSEIYENPPNIYDVEKTLIPNNYKLFGISNGGSLISHYIYQSDFIYISNDTYENFKSILP